MLRRGIRGSLWSIAGYHSRALVRHRHGNVGAAQEECTPGTTKRIAFMLKQQTAYRYLHADVPFFKEAAEAAGYEVLVQSAENDAQTQVSQAENVITQGVDAIVIQPVDFNVAAAIAQKAAEAGIPLASYDDLILGAEHAAFVGRDPEAGRRRSGQGGRRRGADRQLRHHRRRSRSDRLNPDERRLPRGARSADRKGRHHPRGRPVHPAWKTEPAQANAENALTKANNDIQAFLVSYDGMSLGVLQAIEAAGIPDGQILVTGQDMELSAMQAIVEGRQYGSLWPAPDEMAKRGAEVAIALAQCQPITTETTINNEAADIPWALTPIYLVTKDEIADFVCEHLVAADRRGLRQRA